jgi:hypothetical protein
VALTPAQARSRIDGQLATLWTTLQARQTAYMASHNGRPWQGLRCFNSPPADGEDGTPDRKTSHPTDQPEDWNSIDVLPTQLSACVWVDIYQTPSGAWGYVATVRGTLGGQSWQRAAQVGPETWRAHGWTQVI